nr:hypothetical protein [Tanacetum cinerariifolium]
MLQVQHQVSDRFKILLVESEEDPASPLEIHQENLERSIHLQVISPSTCLRSPLWSYSVSHPPKACITPRAPVPPVWFSWFWFVRSGIGICRTSTVTGQMAKSVALVAFGSTWTIMVIVAFRTQRLRSAVMFLLPVPCSVISASILPLVRLLLVMIVLRSVIQLLLVLSLAFSKSVDLFVH